MTPLGSVDGATLGSVTRHTILTREQSITAADFSPALFAAGAIEPDTTAFKARLEALLGTVSATNEVPPQVTRAARESGTGIFGPLLRSEHGIDRVVPGPGSGVPVRVFLPERDEGIYLHIHGGGWVLGRAHHQDQRLEAIAARNLAVVSTDYRLAPEYPYPAGPDDCEAVALWLAKQGGAEFGSERIVIGGESAGGHLPAVTLLRMRDRHGYTGFAGANLVYGAHDLTMTPSVASWGPRNLVLSTPMIAWFIEQFAGGRDLRDPDLSPLYAGLDGMPPALCSAGTLDPLLDDSLFMYRRWVAAGRQAVLAVYPGGVHGFNAFPTAMAARANARMEEFIAGAVQQDRLVQAEA